MQCIRNKRFLVARNCRLVAVSKNYRNYPVIVRWNTIRYPGNHYPAHPYWRLLYLSRINPTWERIWKHMAFQILRFKCLLQQVGLFLCPFLHSLYAIIHHRHNKRRSLFTLSFCIFFIFTVIWSRICILMVWRGLKIPVSQKKVWSLRFAHARLLLVPYIHNQRFVIWK